MVRSENKRSPTLIISLISSINCMLAYRTVLQEGFDSVHGLGAAGGDRCCLVAPWWQI